MRPAFCLRSQDERLGSGFSRRKSTRFDFRVGERPPDAMFRTKFRDGERAGQFIGCHCGSPLSAHLHAGLGERLYSARARRAF